jgi:MFS transporter, MHS family, proline/betaine transporter
MQSLKKTIAIGLIGNILEWYDFTVYGYMAAVIAPLFFPSDSPTISLISIFAVFAVGFIMRPLGAMFFGSLGDRLGRKQALLISIMLISIPTVVMGLLPVYSKVGLLAPLTLILCRLAQGLSVGGEYTSAILYLTEHAPANRKGFAGSFVLVGAGAGWLLGSFVASVTVNYFPEPALVAGAWRIPFILGGAAALFGLIVRSSSQETAPYIDMQKSGEKSENPIREVFASQKASLISMIGFNLLSTVAGYLIYAYMPTYLSQETGLPLSEALMLNTFMLMIFIGIVPVVGFLSDIIDRTKLMLVGALGFIVLSYPLFSLLLTGKLSAVIPALLIMTALIAIYHAPLPTLMAEFFPVRTRASSVGIAYNFAASVFSGTCPLMCTLLIKMTGSPLSPGIYLVIVGTISFASILIVRESQKKNLRLIYQEF